MIDQRMERWFKRSMEPLTRSTIAVSAMKSFCRA
jgi:hypothetical protein